MRTGWLMWPGLPDLELHNRALLAAVGDVAALAGDPVGLPVVRAGGVQPELGEVEERQLDAELAALLLGLLDGLLAADHTVGVLLLGLADVHVDLAGAGEAALHGRPL